LQASKQASKQYANIRAISWINMKIKGDIMRNIKGKLAILLLGFTGFVNVANAALNDLGNGLVNDTSLNITWMKDANLVKTSCDANNALWQAFDPSTLPAAQQSGRTKAQICTANGTLNWFEAEAWMSVLNAQNYLGYNDWRQPSTTQPDASCESQVPAGGGNPAQGFGYNCTGSELGNLFNVSLNNPNDAGTGATGGTVGTGCFVGTGGTAPADCFQTVGPFSNAQSFAYWSGVEYAPVTTDAWDFNTRYGFQNYFGKGNDGLFVWPVRSGQSVVAPVTPQNVPSLSIWGLGIMSLLLAFVARRKAR